MRLAGHRPDRRRAAEVLDQLGLAAKARRRPGQLSGVYGSFAAAILVVGTAAATLPALAALRGETLER